MENNETKKELVFSCSEIRERGGFKISKTLDISLPLDAFSRSEKIQKISLDINFSIGSDSILTEGIVTGMLDIECARCGELFTWKFSENFDETYPDSVEYINIYQLIRETILMALPMKPLCSQSCRGYCLICGKNLNREKCNCPMMERDNTFKKLKYFKNTEG